MRGLSQYRKAAVMHGINSITVEKIDMVEPKDDEVLVNIKSVGICGSDIAYYTKGRTGVAEVKPPHILGHECSGEVVKIGQNVKNIKVGDRVAVEPGKPCGKCQLCLEGKYNLCNEMIFMSTPNPNPMKKGEGAFVEYSTRPSEFVFPIPENMTFDEAAMIEPLAVALQALEKGNIKAGKSALILGCGPIGLCILLALKAYGCTDIYMTDIVDYRLKQAKELGATKVFNALEEDYEEIINKLTNGKGIDVVFDTTCNEKAIQSAVNLVAKAGNIVLVGVSTRTDMPFDMVQILKKEITIRSSFRYNNKYPLAIKLVASGLIDIKKIISHKMPIEEISEAMKMVSDKTEGVIKVVLNI